MATNMQPWLPVNVMNDRWEWDCLQLRTKQRYFKTRERQKKLQIQLPLASHASKFHDHRDRLFFPNSCRRMSSCANVRLDFWSFTTIEQRTKGSRSTYVVHSGELLGKDGLRDFQEVWVGRNDAMVRRGQVSSTWMSRWNQVGVMILRVMVSFAIWGWRRGFDIKFWCSGHCWSGQELIDQWRTLQCGPNCIRRMWATFCRPPYQVAFSMNLSKNMLVHPLWES